MYVFTSSHDFKKKISKSWLKVPQFIVKVNYLTFDRVNTVLNVVIWIKFNVKWFVFFFGSQRGIERNFTW